MGGHTFTSSYFYTTLCSVKYQGQIQLDLELIIFDLKYSHSSRIYNSKHTKYVNRLQTADRQTDLYIYAIYSHMLSHCISTCRHKTESYLYTSPDFQFQKYPLSAAVILSGSVVGSTSEVCKTAVIVILTEGKEHKAGSAFTYIT